LANLVRLGLATASGLEVEDLGHPVAGEYVVTASALTLGEAEATKEGAEVVEAERAIGGTAQQAGEELSVASHAGTYAGEETRCQLTPLVKPIVT
jgi:phage-related baseplate assembly protein